MEACVASDPAPAGTSGHCGKRPGRNLHDPSGSWVLGGLHPKSEVSDKPIGDGRQLTIEWTTGL